MSIEGIGGGPPEFEELPESLAPEDEIAAAWADLGDHGGNSRYPDGPYPTVEMIVGARLDEEKPERVHRDDPDEDPGTPMFTGGQPSSNYLSDLARAGEEADGGTQTDAPTPLALLPAARLEAADTSLISPAEVDERSGAEGHGDSAGARSDWYEPEAAARRNLQGWIDDLAKIAEGLADCISVLEASVDRSEEVQDEIDACEDMGFQLAVLKKAMEMVGRGGSSQSAKQTFFLTAQAQAFTEAAEENKRRFPQSTIWNNRFFKKLAAKLPWLVPSVAALTEVREWSAGGSLGLPGVFQGNFNVIFGRPTEK